MKKTIAHLAVAAVFVAGFGFVMSAAANDHVKKIVVFSDALNEPGREALIARFGGVTVKNLDLIGAKAVLLPPRAVVQLARQPGVIRVDDDVTVFALHHRPGHGGGSTQPAQTIPWGIVRVEAPASWETSIGGGVKVAVIDTGIDLKHPDLEANIKGGYNAVNPRKAPNDDNGHGTHVAGTIAALNNDIGVVGVSPAAHLYAVKVLRADGSGFLSDVIKGIEWAVANGMQVANMSLGTSSDIPSFRDAVAAAYNAGVLVVAAAGNNGGAVIYPAAYPEAIAVSAIDQNDEIASFSSRGPEIELAAPGVSVYSTYKDSSYATLSGTSMAAPHAAGVAALVWATAVGNADENGNGIWDAPEVRKRLRDSAEDLGEAGFDWLYGWGLVKALAAVSF